MISVELWTAEEVAGWMRHIGLPDCAKTFLGESADSRPAARRRSAVRVSPHTGNKTP